MGWGGGGGGDLDAIKNGGSELLELIFVHHMDSLGNVTFLNYLGQKGFGKMENWWKV